MSYTVTPYTNFPKDTYTKTNISLKQTYLYYQLGDLETKRAVHDSMYLDV